MISLYPYFWRAGGGRPVRPSQKRARHGAWCAVPGVFQFADLSFLHHIPVKWVPYFSICIYSRIFDEGRGLLDD